MPLPPLVAYPRLRYTQDVFRRPLPPNRPNHYALCPNTRSPDRPARSSIDRPSPETASQLPVLLPSPYCLPRSRLSQMVYLRTTLSASRVAPHLSADLDLRPPRPSRLTLAHTTLISTALANDVVPVCSFDIATIYFVLHWNIFPFHSILFAICTLSSRLDVVSVSSGSCNKALFY